MESLQSIPRIPSKLPKGVNWKAVIFWGIVLGLIGLVVYWFRDDITAWISRPNIDLANITQMLTVENIFAFLKNYGPLISIGFAGVTAVYGLYERHQKNVADTAKVYAEGVTAQVESAATARINQIWGEKEAALKEVAELKSHDLASAYSSIKDELAQKDQELKSAWQQNQQLMDKLANTPVKVVEVVK